MAKVQYTIRVESNILEEAKEVAEKEMRSLNNLIEFFIAKGIESYNKTEELKANLLDENEV